MRRADAGDPGRRTAGQRDLPWRVLATTAARMRSGRRDWGLAMLAELDHITAPWDRARFGFGAARVALFPPHPSRPRGAGPVGLSVRAVIAGTAIHALAPAAGITVAVLAALPAAPSANASPLVNLDAFLHGARTGAAWLASDNLGGSVIALTWAPVAVFVLAAVGAHAGWAIRAVLWPPRRTPASRAAP
jgi:hypothetical protein